jgi:metal-responsive CopG/Arc/MetJ family transcriptional regulator
MWITLWIELRNGNPTSSVGLQLLKATDSAAKRRRVNRSALIRHALQRYLKHLHDLELENGDRKGYLAQPQQEDEFHIWEEAASWPRR